MEIQFVACLNRKLMADPVFAVDDRPGWAAMLEFSSTSVSVMQIPCRIDTKLGASPHKSKIIDEFPISSGHFVFYASVTKCLTDFPKHLLNCWHIWCIEYKSKAKFRLPQICHVPIGQRLDYNPLTEPRGDEYIDMPQHLSDNAVLLLYVCVY